MFEKLLVANCSDNVRNAGVAAQAHLGAADAMPEPERVLRVAHAGGLDAGTLYV